MYFKWKLFTDVWHLIAAGIRSRESPRQDMTFAKLSTAGVHMINGYYWRGEESGYTDFNSTENKWMSLFMEFWGFSTPFINIGNHINMSAMKRLQNCTSLWNLVPLAFPLGILSKGWSIVIGCPRAHLWRNWCAIAWVSDLTFCNCFDYLRLVALDIRTS